MFGRYDDRTGTLVTRPELNYMRAVVPVGAVPVWGKSFNGTPMIRMVASHLVVPLVGYDGTYDWDGPTASLCPGCRALLSGETARMHLDIVLAHQASCTF